MELKPYFENAEGNGILATADVNGKVEDFYNFGKRKWFQ